MNSRFHRFIHENYIWLAIIVTVCTIILVLFIAKDDRRQDYIITSIAGGGGLIYFFQKQKLEECKLFGDYFFRFNQEYLKQTEKLDRVFEKTKNGNRSRHGG